MKREIREVEDVGSVYVYPIGGFIGDDGKRDKLACKVIASLCREGEGVNFLYVTSERIETQFSLLSEEKEFVFLASSD